MPEGLAYRPELLSAEEEPPTSSIWPCCPSRRSNSTASRGNAGSSRSAGATTMQDGSSGRLQIARVPPAAARTRGEVAGLAPEGLQHALVTEYAPGAPIGWHRDRPQFQDVVGVSFLAPCLFRFRLRLREGWERARSTDAALGLPAARRRADRMEHSIPPVRRCATR